MAWKLLLDLIFNTATGKTIAMYVKKAEPGMVQFTNEWYLFRRDGKFVLKNLDKGLIYETSDDFASNISPEMIDGIKQMLKDEISMSFEDIVEKIESTVNKVIEPIADAVETVGDAIGEAVEEIEETIEETIEKIEDAIDGNDDEKDAEETESPVNTDNMPIERAVQEVDAKEKEKKNGKNK